MRRLPGVSFRWIAALAGLAAALAVTSAAAAALEPQAGPGTVLSRTAQGFSLTVPSGWQEYQDSSAAAAVLLSANPSVVVVVRVLAEPAPADTSTTLAAWLATLFNDADRTVVAQSFEVFLGRPALVADLESATTRTRVTIVARDAGDRSQIFYAIVSTAPQSVFTKVSATLARVTEGFQIGPMGGAPASPAPAAAVSGLRPPQLAAPSAAPPAVPAQAPPVAIPPPPATTPAPAPREPQAPTAARAVVPEGALNRARAFERILKPGTAAKMQAAATLSKDAKSRAEAAAAYDRALVFYEQGAFAEAEKEFRNAEKKDGDNVETVLALGWVYNKVHKPDDAIKRFEKVYKKNPRNTRALVGIAASYEEMQNYREAVRMWQRYVRADLSAPEQREAQALLASAQDLFVERYEIAENPGGGAANALTKDQELQLGLRAAQEFAKSGVEPVKDDVVVTYVMNLCAYLVANAKNFPSNYQVFVIDTADVNAFTMPGFIFVNRGLLAVVDTEAELAGVLAHEIGHAVAHHSAKKLTKAAADEQQAEQWRNSNSKFLRWLGSSSGSSYGQAAFSREAEAQADRLAVHITYDSGIDPRGFASFFQRLESIAPSSRKAWDLMSRTHPFSIDRLNTINAYIELLPPRPRRTTSPEFARMKARLSELPQPTDAVGMQRPALEPPRQAPPSTPEPQAGALTGATQTFTMDTVPFAGEIPAGWGGRKSPAGTFIFEGPKGTESYEVTIELGFEPKGAGVTIDHLAQQVVDVLSRKPQAQVQAPARETADDGTQVRLIRATYALQGQSGNPVPIRHLTAVLDYPGYYVFMSYFTPESIYQKYSEVFSLFVKSFRHTGR